MRDESSAGNNVLLNAEEVAEYLGVGPVTVYRWCRNGDLRAIKVGKFWRIRREALDEFLRKAEYHTLLGEQVKSFMAVLPAHIAVLDSTGTIVATNKAWKTFAQNNGGDLRKVAEGVNYLRICDSARDEQAEYAAAFAEGIRSVLSDRQEEFTLEYPCHSPMAWRWFLGRVRNLPVNGTQLVVVAHENITDRKRLEKQLEGRE